MTIRQIMTRRSTLVGLAVVLVVAISAAWGSLRTGEPAETALQSDAQPLPVETLVAEQVDSYQTARAYTGVIRARRDTVLSFERLGTLKAIHVDEGQRVERGDVLAELDTRRLQVGRTRLEARRNEAAAMLAELVAGPRQETIDAADANVDNLKAQLDLEKANLVRRKALLADNIIPQEEYDASMFGVQAAAARLEAAQRQLDELTAGTRQEKIDAQKAVFETLDAELADVNIELEDSALLAPFSGTVSQRMVDEGAVIAAGAPIVQLVEDQALEAWIGLPVNVASRFVKGHTVQLLVDDKPHAAVVKSLMPGLDADSRTRTVVFTFDEGNAQALVPEQVVRLRVESQTDAQGFWLPTDALAAGPRGLWNCYSVVDGRVQQQVVEVLHTEGDRVLVRGTLADGDPIIASGTHRVVAGQQVRMLSEQSQATKPQPAKKKR